MLTSTDVQELTWWFAEPAPTYVAGRLAAQSYDPRGSGFDLFTSTRLESMLQQAKTRGQSEWARIRRILDGVGALHADVLRRAFGPRPANALPERHFRYPEVVVVTDVVLRAAREGALRDEHMRLLAVSELAARRDGCSPMSTAVRVLETDRHIIAKGIVVTEAVVRAAARQMLERAVKLDLTELLVPAKQEMQRLVDAAGDAYRRVRAELGATKRADRAAQRRVREAYLDEQLGKKRKRESDRFEAALRRAS